MPLFLVRHNAGKLRDCNPPAQLFFNPKVVAFRYGCSDGGCSIVDVLWEAKGGDEPTSPEEIAAFMADKGTVKYGSLMEKM